MDGNKPNYFMGLGSIDYDKDRNREQSSVDPENITLNFERNTPKSILNDIYLGETEIKYPSQKEIQNYIDKWLENFSKGDGTLTKAAR